LPATFEIHFGGGLSFTNINPLNDGGDSLTGVGDPDSFFNTNINGLGNESQQITVNGGGPFTLALNGVPATGTVTNPTAAQLLAHLNTIPAGRTTFRSSASFPRTPWCSAMVRIFGRAAAVRLPSPGRR
jgi:hypothetical protein